jgi:ADP-ribose pyrophosphatase
MSATEQPERLNRQVIYQSRWVNLFVDQVRFPNGVVIDQHHLLDFGRGAVMAVVQDQAGKYLMVKQCRYTTGRSEWEFPAGAMQDGEEVIQAARREIMEETGYQVRDPVVLYSFHPMVGLANKVNHVVRCQADGSPGRYDTQEISAVAWFQEEDIWAMIHSGEMMDGFCLTAFLLHKSL